MASEETPAKQQGLHAVPSTEPGAGYAQLQTAESLSPGLFPVFLKLAGRRCLVVGGGKTGEAKTQGLLAAGAQVRVVAPQATETVAVWARAGTITWRQGCFEPADLDGIFLAVVATSIRELNQRIFEEARQRGVLCNVVDDPPHCDFYYPAVVRQGDLQIAISTNGRSPALAQRLKHELEAQFGPEYGAWLNHLGREREKLFRQAMDPERRRQALHLLASAEQFQAFVRRDETSVCTTPSSASLAAARFDQT